MSRCDNFTFSAPFDDGFFVDKDSWLEANFENSTVRPVAEDNVIKVAAENNVIRVPPDKMYTREER